MPVCTLDAPIHTRTLGMYRPKFLRIFLFAQFKEGVLYLNLCSTSLDTLGKVTMSDGATIARHGSLTVPPAKTLPAPEEAVRSVLVIRVMRRTSLAVGIKTAVKSPETGFSPIAAKSSSGLSRR